MLIGSWYSHAQTEQAAYEAETRAKIVTGLMDERGRPLDAHLAVLEDSRSETDVYSIEGDKGEAVHDSDAESDDDH